MTTGYGMDIEDISVNENVSGNEMSLSATLTNTSVKEIQNVSIYIKEYFPHSGKYQYYVGGVYPVNLTAGESNTFTFNCNYIEGLDYTNISIVIEVFEGTIDDLRAKVDALNEDEVYSAGAGVMGGITLDSVVSGTTSWGGAETEFDHRYDLQVDGEYIKSICQLKLPIRDI